MNLADHALRLFPDIDNSVLELESSEPFVVCRLLEQGDSRDLTDLFAETREDTVRSVFRSRASRTIDRRSRAFWALVLRTEPQPEHPMREALWLL